VRWLRAAGGSVSQSLIAPLAARLAESGRLTTQSARVTALELDDGGAAATASAAATPQVSAVKYAPLNAKWGDDSGGGALDDIDGAVLAVGLGGMRAIVRGSPDLAAACPELSAAASLGAVDVISVRRCRNPRRRTVTPLWLRGTILTRHVIDTGVGLWATRGSGRLLPSG
jgi:hypothetical protein